MKKQPFLEGAYDIHVHASPDVIPRAMNVVQLAKAAIEQKMAGLLIKDHTTATTGRVFTLNHLLNGSCRFFSSLALNAPVGFVNLSAVESLELIKNAKIAGIKRIVVTHASESVVDMEPDQQKEATHMGAMIEHCFFAVTKSCPDKIQIERIRDQIRYVGISSCILSSDFGQVENGSPIEGFHYYLEKMRALGFSDDELRLMIHDNPKKLIERAGVSTPGSP